VFGQQQPVGQADAVAWTTQERLQPVVETTVALRLGGAVDGEREGVDS
jgi:hypothetical protein